MIRLSCFLGIHLSCKVNYFAMKAGGTFFLRSHHFRPTADAEVEPRDVLGTTSTTPFNHTSVKNAAAIPSRFRGELSYLSHALLLYQLTVQSGSTI